MTRTLAFLALVAATGTLLSQDLLTIQNELLEVRFQTTSGRFSLTSKPSGRAFVTDGLLSVSATAAKVTAETDPLFGAGQSISVSSPNGDQHSIQLFPGLPFVLFRSSLRNSGTEPKLVQQFRAMSGTVDLGKSSAELKILGTGGLVAPAKNPGSYVWMAVADPQTRRGVVAGWLTQDRGSGVILAEDQNGSVRLNTQIDYGHLRLNPGKAEQLETLAVGDFEDARLGLEAWANTVAKIYKIKLRPQPVGYCTWYSSPYGGASDEKHLAQQSAFAATNLAPFGFSVIQIDDHWQAGVSTNGPKRNFTTHAPKGPYPGGMKPAADNVKALGLVPGLWFMPFAGTYYDPFFEDHQDWFVKRTNGEPYETAWGGTCLDMTHPGAREYLRTNIRRIAQEWGYQYFKMDGLWTGTGTKQQYVNDSYKPDGIGDAVFSNPDKSNIEAYRDGLKLIREAAGPDIFFLGCCSPQNMRSYGGAFGLVDAMRIGPDNGANWNGLLRGPSYGTRQYFLHGRIWYNDPDPVYVRANIPLQQAQAIASWVTISGQLNLNSEWLPALPPERLDILKRTMPSHRLLPRPVDLFEEPLARIWLLTDERRSTRRDVVGVFNWSNKETAIDYPLGRIGLSADTEYVGFDFWENTLITSLQGRMQMKMPAQSCRVLAVRPQLDRPQLIGTSRHITQGIVDVLDEQWNADLKALRGRSKIVGGDTYELRVVAQGKGKKWQATEIELSAADRAAGVKAGYEESGPLLRAKIESPVSREVEWVVKFR